MQNSFLRSFQQFANNLKERGEYVDLSNCLNIKCNDCEMVFQSQEDGMEHAINYNHWNFNEIKS